MPSGPQYLAVAGTIGAGKSTLVDFLCKHFKLKPFFEPNHENPYLVDFYADMSRWAFHSQVFFLTHKFRLHQELDERRQTATVVQDRTIYEDAEIFAENLHRLGHLSDRDYESYQALYRAILRSLRPPDLLIYLRAPGTTLRRRIKLRGRPEEQGVDPDYLRKLSKRYDAWIETYRMSEVLTIDTGKLDYIEDLVDRIELLKTIEKYL